MAFSVTPNSPTLGSIAWEDAHIVYDGVDYPIANGHTDKRFVFWAKVNPASFYTSNEYPALGTEDAIVFLNKNGVPISVLTASTTEGDLVVPGTITSAAIATDAISADHIQSDAIVARHIVAGAITSEKLYVNELSAISANLGTATAGNFTLNSLGYIRGGAVTYASGTGIWMGYHNGFYKFRAGVPGSSMVEWSGTAFNVYGPDGNITISSGVVDYAKLANQPQSLGDISATEAEKLTGVELGATRNVFRGDWVTGTDYQLGDTVLYQGGGWTCAHAHASVNGNKPPLTGTSNSWWKLYAAKGADGVQGLHAITIVMPNQSHTLPSTFSGVVSTYAGSGSEIYVYEGTTILGAVSTLTADGQFTVGTPVASPLAAITSGAVSYSATVATIADHSGMSNSVDSVTLTYPITIRRTNGAILTLEATQTLSKSKAGASAKTVSVAVSTLFIKRETDGSDTPAQVALNVNSQFATGPITYDVISGTATVVNSGGATATINASSMMTDQVTVRVTQDGAQDQVTIARIKDGEQGLHALTVVMPNQAHNLMAAFSGSVTNYAGSGTEIYVYEGSTLLAARSTLSANGQFTVGTPVLSPLAAITPGIVSYGTNIATIADHSGMSGSIDSVTLTYPITVRRTNGATVTMDAVQTISKSKAGASSKVVSMSVSTQFIKRGADGIDTPSQVTINVSSQFATGPILYEVISGGATVNNSGGPTATIDASSMTTDQITVRATQDGVQDQVTIARVKDGLQGIDYDVQIESSHGTIFRRGGDVTTTLIAHVFKNGVEVTNSIPASAFKWRRVSIQDPAPPNTDAAWNIAYGSGYKQVQVTTDSLWSRATYHCDIQNFE